MERAEFTLSRPVWLSLPVEEVDKLLREKDGRCALVYLALLRAGGKPFPAESIGLTERELRQTMERLCALGLVSAAGKSSPAPAGRTAPAAGKPGAAEPKLVPAAELPQYTAEDIASRMLSDEPMQTVRREAEQLYGRKLTTPEMNMLLGLRDYLGLPADVLMELLHYVFQEYRAARGHAGTPTLRRIEKEAYAWADQEIHTTAQAEEYLQRRQARRELAQQVLQVLQIQDRAPSRTERGYITSWLDMGFGCDAIAEAYDRTVVATGARKWAYLNRILMSWHEKGCTRPRRSRPATRAQRASAARPIRLRRRPSATISTAWSSCSARWSRPTPKEGPAWPAMGSIWRAPASRSRSSARKMSARTAAAWTTPTAACPACARSIRRCSSR